MAKIPFPSAAGQFLDPRTGLIVPEWYQKLAVLFDRVGAGAAEAWVSFNGSGTLAIRDDGAAKYNVTDVTDNNTGDYTVNFSKPFSKADSYMGVIVAGRGTAGAGLRLIAQAPYSAAPTTIAYRFLITDAAGTPQDAEYVQAAFFGY
jgi:hypothetical protein